MNWQSSDIEYLYNPKINPDWKQRLESVKSELPELPGHLWILSSGSTALDNKKWIAISKKAFLASAESVNHFYRVTDEDVWLRVLPRFHVGGLAIEARAHLSGSRVVVGPEKWDAKSTFEIIDREKVSIISLVPTQLYDLLELGLKAPKSLRLVIIGGGSMSTVLLEKARKLGYKVSPSYGMTETASQIASGIHHIEGHRIFYKQLKHAEFQISEDSTLQIKAASLMTGYAKISMDSYEFIEVKPDTWFETSDLALLEDGGLCILGRKDDVVKVSGELVNLQSLRQKLSDLGTDEHATVLAVPDERLENRLIIVFENHLLEKHEQILKDYEAIAMPYEKPSEVYFVPKLPLSELSKIKWAELKSHLGY